MQFKINNMAWLLLVALITACGGGGGGGSTHTVPPATTDNVTTPPGQYLTCNDSLSTVVSNARIGDPFVFVNGSWKVIVSAGTPPVWDITHTWVIRGTLEDDAFMPAVPVWWYGPSNGPGEPRSYWTLSTSPLGIRSTTNKTAENTPPLEINAYAGSFINDAFTKPACVKNHPIATVEYTILGFSGDKARATIGFSMSLPDGSHYFLEQNLIRTEQFRLCANKQFDRCEGTFLIYFPPNENSGVVDIRALLLLAPGMTPEKADTMKIDGVYIGSEIYGIGTVDILIKSYKLETR